MTYVDGRDRILNKLFMIHIWSIRPTNKTQLFFRILIGYLDLTCYSKKKPTKNIFNC